MSMIYRVNAGAVPADSWMQDPQLGGGRLLGEACHFVDFLVWLCEAAPRTVHAACLSDPAVKDTVSLTLTFADGSMGTIHYFANGSKRLAKEYVEVYQFGNTHVLHDFRELRSYDARQSARKKAFVQDKGQEAMLRSYFERVTSGGEPLIPPTQLFAVSEITLAALGSIRRNGSVSLEPQLTGEPPEHIAPSETQ